MSRNLNEETLDPEDWDEFKRLGHRMVEDAITHLQNIRDHPTLPLTEEAFQNLLVPLSEEGEGAEQVYDSLLENLIPYFVGMTRPQFWGWVAGTGSPLGALVDMLISTRNAGAGGILPLVVHTLNWIKELLEIPKEYSGVFVSGGSEASFTGLAIARNAKAEVDMKTQGMQGVERKMVLYASEEIHHCLERSVELLGLGHEAIRWVPVDDLYRINLEELEKAIKEDKEQGLHPFCVIGNAGTVNTGAFDDLNALADICQREEMWFHIDGAFGAWVKLSETHKHLADGLERGDSIAVDFHKWMNMPYAIGLTLVKDKAAHYRTFVYGRDAAYLDIDQSELDLDALTIMSSLALSRRNTGLKAYTLLRAFGKDKYSTLIQQNIDGIRYLADKLEKDPLFEVTAPVVSNIVCFRYNPGNLSDEQVDKLNKKILDVIWSGVMGQISSTSLKGRYTLRACNVNHRTRLEDFDEIVDRIKDIAAGIDKEELD